MRKGDSTRQRIIVEAAPVFNQRGFAGSSMQNLMDATGLEKGGIYRHFPSKEALASEALRFALAQSLKTRTDHLDEIDGSLNKLRKAIELFVELPSAVAGGCPLMNTAIDADDGNPTLRAIALKGIQAWRSRLARIVDQGLKSGEIRPGTDSRRIANSIIATLEGALMISRLERSKTALRDARQTLEVVLADISAI